jgi:membrane-anchored mycosin MYCP
VVSGAGSPASPRVSAPLPPPADADHSTRDTAIIASAVATILAALLVGAAVVIPRGRRRGWQPTRRAPTEP